MKNEISADSLFNPEIGFASRQLQPFMLNGSLGADGTLSLGFAKEKAENSRFGFNVNTVMSPDRFELQPTITYSLTKDIALTHFIGIDTNAHVKW